MIYAIFVHHNYSNVEGKVIEVEDENDEFITWYKNNNRYLYVFFLPGSVKIPEKLEFSTKEIELSF